MPRVSENSTRAAMNTSINRAKAKLEDLQLKGSTLKKMTKPSDDPVSNVNALMISSENTDNNQYQRNIIHAVTNLTATDQALESLVEIMNKAKELAITQASDFYDKNIRSNVANEVVQLRNSALAIANKRIGSKYIFSGYKTLTRPFGLDGNYNGDGGHTNLEVSKDFFVPINLNGVEVFYGSDFSKDKREHPLNEFPAINNPEDYRYDEKDKDYASEDGILNVGRDLASIERIKTDKEEASDTQVSEEKINETKFENSANVFSLLSGLTNALENDDTRYIQDLLEKLDTATSRLITLRTRVGSISNSILKTRDTLEADFINNEAKKSQLVDADVAELFSDITRHQDTLKTTYQASKTVLNKNLLDFLG
jgi:flagellar hook-associated protein 3 FlgL